MNRLQTELQRLYLPHEGQPAGWVRAMLLEVTRPAGWDALGKAWHGVQADLELPAPGIAVSGTDSYQLWFSFARAVPAARALAFLEDLRQRYLGEVAPERVGMKPVTVLPPLEVAPGQWSAFVAPDLAAVFADERWLDLPPNPAAQADVLARLVSMELREAEAAPAQPASAPPTQAAAPAAGGGRDPKSFLLGIMNDPAIELRLRIEAAKALLPWCEERRVP